MDKSLSCVVRTRMWGRRGGGGACPRCPKTATSYSAFLVNAKKCHSRPHKNWPSCTRRESVLVATLLTRYQLMIQRTYLSSGLSRRGSALECDQTRHHRSRDLIAKFAHGNFKLILFYALHSRKMLPQYCIINRSCSHPGDHLTPGSSVDR